MILFNMTMSVCSFVEWSCCCLLDVFCIVECEFVGFCADQNRTEWVWSATCETVRRVFVALEHRCLWSAVVCSAPAVLDVSSVLRSCFIVQSENKRRDSFYQKSQYGTQSYDVFRGSTTRRTNLRLPQDERVDVTLVELKPETCSWSKAAVRWRYVVLTASWLWTKAASHVLLLFGGSLWKTSLRVTWTEQCGATVWTRQSGVSNVSSSRANDKLTC